MSATKKTPQVKIALNVERTTGPMVIPDSWSWDDVIEFATRSKEAEDHVVNVRDKIRAFPLDAAYALGKALERKFGMALVQGEWGSPVNLVSVERGPEDIIGIPWGEFQLPSNTGVLTMQASIEDGQQVLNVLVRTRRKYETAVREIVKLAREILKTESLYKARALRLIWRANFFSGEFADVRFMHTANVQRSDLIFTSELERAIDTNIWTLLQYPHACRTAKIPIKRGILLAGEYGVGKTLLATVTAKIATEAGWTFIYLDDTERVGEALMFAQQYAPAVVFAEDVDRVASERDDQLNEILNKLDGIETKDHEVMVILSTNHPETIHPALLRPGRTDVILNLTAPDGPAVERLIRKYAGARLPETEALGRVSQQLAGQIPATIREVVERSKLESIRRTGGDAMAELMAEDVGAAAFTVLQQRELVSGNGKHGTLPVDQQAGVALHAMVKDAIENFSN